MKPTTNKYETTKNKTNTADNAQKESCENSNYTSRAGVKDNANINNKTNAFYKDSLLHLAEEAAAAGDVLTVLEIYHKVFEKPFIENQEERVEDEKTPDTESVETELAQEDIFQWVLLLAEAGEFKKAYKTCEKITDPQLSMRVQNMFDLRELEIEWDFGLSLTKNIHSETKSEAKSVTKQDIGPKLKFRKIPATHEIAKKKENLKSETRNLINELSGSELSGSEFSDHEFSESPDPESPYSEHPKTAPIPKNPKDNEGDVDRNLDRNLDREKASDIDEDIDDLLDPDLPDPRYVSKQKTVLQRFHQ